MVDLSQNQPLNQKPTPDVPASDQPPVVQPVTPPEKPDDTSPPSITTEEKIATPKQEKIKEKLSELGIPPAGGTRKTKVLLAALGILLLIIALPAAVILVEQRQELRKEAVTGCAKEGEVCYGFAGLPCCEGLTCVTEDGLPIQPDKGGICRSGVASPKPALKPDLIVQDLEIRVVQDGSTPSSPVVGDNIRFVGVVKNQGGATATPCCGLDYIYTHFRLDVDNNGTWDWPFDESSGLVGNDQGTGTLAPGATEKESLSGWIAKAGTHKFEVCADWAGWVPGQVDESNEDNNCTTMTFNVGSAPAPKPDLIIQDLEIRPASPVVGNDIGFYGVVKNQGGATATPCCGLDYIYTHFRLDVDNNGTWDWPFDENTGLVGNDQGTGTLAPGATEKESLSGWIAKAGTHKFEVCADWAGWVPGQVDESNEDNNCTTKTFSVGAAPPPEYTAQCDLCKAYDESWNEITDLSTIAVGQTVYFTTRGSTTHPEGITKARFRINSGTWQETTSKHGDEFYIEYNIPAAGSYTVESMVYNPTLGWY